MRYLVTALLALYAAEPVAQWLLNSPVAPTIKGLYASPAVASIFGKPELLLQVGFVLICYELVTLLECMFQPLIGPGRNCSMISVSATPRSLGSSVGLPKNEKMPLPTGVKKPD